MKSMNGQKLQKLRFRKSNMKNPCFHLVICVNTFHLIPIQCDHAFVRPGGCSKAPPCVFSRLTFRGAGPAYAGACASNTKVGRIRWQSCYVHLLKQFFVKCKKTLNLDSKIQFQLLLGRLRKALILGPSLASLILFICRYALCQKKQNI